MKTRDWDRAERRLLDQFDPGSPATKRQFLADAIDKYLDECKVRTLADSTITSYRNSLTALRKFCEAKAARYADSLTLEVLSAFRATRLARDGKTAAKPTTQRKELEALRAFCEFCLKREWMKSNPATDVKAPKESRVPTLPFSDDEVAAIIAACQQIKNNYVASAARARIRTHALLLLLLYSGLRISDCALLKRSSVKMKTGRMFLRTAKTDETVTLTLHKDALAALAALPVESTEYFFWSGKGKVTSIVGSLRRSIDAVLKLAKIKGHPHRFRDTFAIGMLNKGVALREVQLLLGHSSIKITERYYAPFVKGTQVLLDAAVAKLDFGLGTALPTEGVEDRSGNPQGNVIALSA